MDKKTFDLIQELYSSIVAIHPNFWMDDEKEERLYMALHGLNQHMSEIGCKKFDLSPPKK